MNRRPVLAGTAAAAALALCANAGGAAAATTSVAQGKATTSLTLLDLSVAGHSLSLADLALVSDTTTSPRISSLSLTPVTVDGTAYGRQTVNQSSSPKTVDAVTSPSALSTVASLTSPAFDLAATGVPSAHAGTTSLGGIKVLGLPVKLSGALDLATSVTKTGAQGAKTVELTNLALPSINDLLAALGLNLKALPLDTLNQLVDQLDLVTSAITTANGAVDSAQAAVDSALSQLATATSAVAPAQAAVTSATNAVSTLLTPAALALLAGLGITDVASALQAIPSVLASADALVPGIQAAVNTLQSATAALSTAQAAVQTAQTLVNTLQATLAGATTTVKNLIKGRLDAIPLVSLGSLTVQTVADVVSAKAGGQTAKITGGTITGLKVLGTDVLSSALGSSTLNLDSLTAAAGAKVEQVVGTLTDTLSSVLSNVPGYSALVLPAPQIGVLTKDATTGVVGGFGRATTAVHGLSITIPGITVPSALAVPNAAGLPALGGVSQVAGLVKTAPITFDVLTLGDQAAFRPAVVGAPGATGSPRSGNHLAGTGLPAGVVALAMALLGGAIVVRRRLTFEG